MDTLPRDLIKNLFEQLVASDHHVEQSYEPDLHPANVQGLLSLRFLSHEFLDESYPYLARAIKKKPFRFGRVHMAQLDAISQHERLARHLDSLTFSSSAPTADSWSVFRYAKSRYLEATDQEDDREEAERLREIYISNRADDEDYRTKLHIGGATVQVTIIVNRLPSLKAVELQQARTLRTVVFNTPADQPLTIPPSVMTMSFPGATEAQRALASRIISSARALPNMNPRHYQEPFLEDTAARLLCRGLRPTSGSRNISFFSVPNFEFRSRMLNTRPEVTTPGAGSGLTIPSTTTFKLGVHDNAELPSYGNFAFKVPDLLHTLPALTDLRLTTGGRATANTQHVLLKSLRTLRQRPLPRLRAFTVAVALPDMRPGAAEPFDASLVKFVKAHEATLAHFGWHPCCATEWRMVRETLLEIARRVGRDRAPLQSVYLQDPYYPPEPAYPTDDPCLGFDDLPGHEWDKLARKVFIRKFSPEDHVLVRGAGARAEECPRRFPLLL